MKDFGLFDTTLLSRSESYRQLPILNIKQWDNYENKCLLFGIGSESRNSSSVRRSVYAMNFSSLPRLYSRLMLILWN